MNMKQGIVTVETGKLLQFQDTVDTDVSPTDEQEGAIRVGQALNAYRMQPVRFWKGNMPATSSMRLSIYDIQATFG